MVEPRKFLKNIMGEQDFYVLKFPAKLWRIISDCQTGAIRWGPFGKTILIDYQHFSNEYLDCSVPKFKTKNMASFVRQLNMYGFKKMQHNNKLCRAYDIHEFYHEHFRFGRPDLLCLVKRRAIPLKFPKYFNSYDKKFARLDICRNTFEESLLQSNEFKHFWKLHPQISSSAERDTKIIQPAYRIRIIPAESIEIDKVKKELEAVVLRDYEVVLHTEPEASIMEPEESDFDNSGDDEFDHLVDTDGVKSLSGDLNFLSSFMKGTPVQVRNGFDGVNYIIDVIEAAVESSELPSPTKELPKDVPQIQNEAANISRIEEDEPLLDTSDNEDLFACLSSAISGVEN